jgi:ribosomal protein L29
MKKDQKQLLKDKSVKELEARLAEISVEISHAKLNLAMGTLTNVHQIKTLRDEISFIKTIISQK